MKRLLALALALTIIFSFAAPASAITTGKWDFGNITIPVVQPEEEVEYTIILDYNSGYRFYAEKTGYIGYTMRKVTSEKLTCTGTVTLPTNKPTKAPLTFAGWLAPDGTIYQLGDTITVTCDTTLTAIWENNN